MINKNKKTRKLLTAVLVGLLSLGLGLGGFWLYKQNNQVCLYPGIIRFHVIANSNSVTDQALKYQVRDVVVKDMSRQFAGVKDIVTAREVARANLKHIRDLTVQQINSEGKNYPANVEMGHYLFPPRKYQYLSSSSSGFLSRELTLPAGRYETVRITIGQGKGDNWWCVLFPPLCLTDPVGVVKTKKSPDKIEPAFHLDTHQTITTWAPVPAEANDETKKDKTKKVEKSQIEFRFKTLELIHNKTAWLKR